MANPSFMTQLNMLFWSLNKYLQPFWTICKDKCDWMNHLQNELSLVGLDFEPVDLGPGPFGASHSSTLPAFARYSHHNLTEIFWPNLSLQSPVHLAFLVPSEFHPRKNLAFGS